MIGDTSECININITRDWCVRQNDRVNCMGNYWPFWHLEWVCVYHCTVGSFQIFIRCRWEVTARIWDTVQHFRPCILPQQKNQKIILNHLSHLLKEGQCFPQQKRVLHIIYLIWIQTSSSYKLTTCWKCPYWFSATNNCLRQTILKPSITCTSSEHTKLYQFALLYIFSFFFHLFFSFSL